MKCPRCRAQIPYEAAFCDECGYRLELICPSCEEPNRLRAKFCKKCGQGFSETSLGAAKSPPAFGSPQSYIPRHLADRILASREILEGERKRVTVLFADIKGSTELIEGLDPEEARVLIDPALHVMMDAVHRYEGTVNQILGDGIMAFFGAPLAHEDHALRASYAALAMQEEMRRYAEKGSGRRHIPLTIRVGLNSGDVVFRSISNDLSIDYSGLGYTIHLAARMEEVAPAGSIVMTAATLKEVEGFVRVKAQGAVQVKGVSSPVEIFELVGATTLRKRLDVAAARGLTPFVGRKTEIEVFQQLLEQAAIGRGQILGMVGEPGVGKSRLVYELIHLHLTPSWKVLEATSVSYGQASPYFPLIELLKRYFDIGEGEEAGAIQAKVQDYVLKLDDTLGDVIAPVLGLLDALPDDPRNSPTTGPALTEKEPGIVDAIKKFRDLEPRRRREITLAALKRLLIHESQKQPLLLVFEDLHWIDNETQAFLDSFVESLPGARILLLVDYRPGYKHNWATKTYYAGLRLDPLPANRAGELLEFLLGNDIALGPVKQLLVERTEGNPFFLEESVRTLAQTNVLVGAKGAYKLALDAPTIRIPSTVQAVLADRIDRLPPEEKHLLQTAAVIGMTVPLRLLRAVADLSEEALGRALVNLQAAELLYETNLFPEVEYTCKHALTREVVYETLLHERRKALHGRIVGALEEMLGENASDQIEKLALHAFRGELWGKAVPYAREAGLKAMGRSANREAVIFLEQVLTALKHLPEHRETLELAVDLRLDLRNAVFLLGEFARIRDYLDEAQTVAERLGDRYRLRRVLNFRIAYFSLTGEPDRAIEIGEQALGSDMTWDDPGPHIVTNYYMGIVYYTMARYRDAMKVLKQTLALVDQEDRRFERFGTSTIVSVICRTWLVQSLAQTGAFVEGIACGEEGVKIAEQGNHPYSLGYANCSLGFLFLIKGDLNLAIDALERCFKLCQEANIRVLFPQIASYLGFAYALSGRIDEALPLMEKAEQQTISIGRRGGQSLRVAWQGETYLRAGRVEEAAVLAERALDLAEQHREAGHKAWALRLAAEIAGRGDPFHDKGAEAWYRESLASAGELGMQPLKAHCHLGLGRLWAQRADPEKARIELSAAVRLYRETEMTFWLAQAEAVLAELDPQR